MSERVLHALASALLEQGRIDLSEAFIDGTLVPAKRGGAAVGPTKRGMGTKIMAVADRSGLPIALHIESASCGKRLSRITTRPARSARSGASRVRATKTRSWCSPARNDRLVYGLTSGLPRDLLCLRYTSWSDRSSDCGLRLTSHPPQSSRSLPSTAAPPEHPRGGGTAGRPESAPPGPPAP